LYDSVVESDTDQASAEQADRRPSSASRRERVPGRVAAPHLERAFARKLKHVPVEQEEAGEPELVDQLQLVVEPRPRLRAQAVAPRCVAMLEGAVADLRELDDRRL